MRSIFARAFLILVAGMVCWAATAQAANPTIQPVPSDQWFYSDSPPIRFKVENTSKRGEGPRRINSIHIITNAPGSSPMRPLDMYRSHADGSTAAEAPNCTPKGANGLDCTGLDVGPGDTLTVDFTTNPNPYPNDATITVIADTKLETEEILGPPITLKGPGPPPPKPPTPSPYGPPPPIAPPPPGNAMPTTTKKKVAIFAKGAQVTGGTIALYGAYIAFSTGPVPDPATKGAGTGLALLGGAIALIGTVTDFVAELVDPLDPRFRQATHPPPVHAPHLNAGPGIPRALAVALNRLAMNAGRINAYGTALTTAFNRAATATKKDALAARSRQLSAGAGFARKLAGYLDADPALRRGVAHAIQSAQLSLRVRVGRLPAIRRRLRQGPPPELRRVLKAFGLSGSEIRAATRRIANVKLPSPLRRVSSMLLDKRIAAAEHGTADGFRRVALALQAAA